MDFDMNNKRHTHIIFSRWELTIWKGRRLISFNSSHIHSVRPRSYSHHKQKHYSALFWWSSFFVILHNKHPHQTNKPSFKPSYARAKGCHAMPCMVAAIAVVKVWRYGILGQKPSTVGFQLWPPWPLTHCSLVYYTCTCTCKLKDQKSTVIPH